MHRWIEQTPCHGQLFTQRNEHLASRIDLSHLHTLRISGNPIFEALMASSIIMCVPTYVFLILRSHHMVVMESTSRWKFSWKSIECLVRPHSKKNFQNAVCLHVLVNRRTAGQCWRIRYLYEGCSTLRWTYHGSTISEVSEIILIILRLRSFLGLQHVEGRCSYSESQEKRVNSLMVIHLAIIERFVFFQKWYYSAPPFRFSYLLSYFYPHMQCEY